MAWQGDAAGAEAWRRAAAAAAPRQCSAPRGRTPAPVWTSQSIPINGSQRILQAEHFLRRIPGEKGTAKVPKCPMPTVPDAILDQRRKAGSPESSIPAHLPVFLLLFLSSSALLQE